MKDFNTIYSNLKKAEDICAEHHHLDSLFDLIAYNLELLCNEYDYLITQEKEQISNFSIYALKTAKLYKKTLENSLI